MAGATGVNGMVGGQVLGLDRMEGGVDRETLHATHEFGTRALLEASARIGAILAGATPEEQGSVSEYARRLGLCLRITNDILEITASIGEREKSARRGAERATFIRAYGLAGARRLADEYLKEALEVLGRMEGEKQGLAEMARFARFGCLRSGSSRGYS